MDLSIKLMNLFEDVRLIRKLGKNLSVQSLISNKREKDIEKMITMLLLIEGLDIPDILTVFEDVPQEEFAAPLGQELAEA